MFLKVCIRIGIISHVDPTDRMIVLPDHQRKAQMLSKMFRWTKIEHEGILWEEFNFLKNILDQKHEQFNVWEMPLYSGLHIQSVIEKYDRCFQTLLINAITDENHQEEYDKLVNFDPEYLFISTTFILNKEQLKFLIESVRKKFPYVPIILGGNYVVKEIFYGHNVSQLMEICGDNVFVVASRYSEEKIQDILNNIIKIGIVWENGRIIGDKEKQDIYDIDKWAVDYDKINYSYFHAPLKVSVSCPFSCNFCSYPEIGGKYVQSNIGTIINQLKALKAKGVKRIIFNDDTLNFPVKRYVELLKAMIGQDLIDFECFSFCRCQFLDEETVKLMKDCGFSSVLLGIESGSETILKNMNKHANLEEYREGIRLLKKYEITTFGAIIIGFPGETKETLAESIDFLNTSGLDYTYVQPFYYLHNSPIHKKANQYGLSGEGLHWKHDTMNSNQCLDLLEDFIFQVDGPVYANEEYAMWELLYFLYKGYSKGFYRDYRILLSDLRRLNLKREDQYEKKQNQFIQAFRKKYKLKVKI